MSNVTVITHPLVQHKLTLMRKKDASTNSFRRLLGELSTLMAYEVTRDMPLQDVQIETPLETMTGKMIDGKKLVLAPILRAGWQVKWILGNHDTETEQSYDHLVAAHPDGDLGLRVTEVAGLIQDAIEQSEADGTYDSGAFARVRTA